MCVSSHIIVKGGVVEYFIFAQTLLGALDWWIFLFGFCDLSFAHAQMILGGTYVSLLWFLSLGFCLWILSLELLVFGSEFFGLWSLVFGACLLHRHFLGEHLLLWYAIFAIRDPSFGSLRLLELAC